MHKLQKNVGFLAYLAGRCLPKINKKKNSYFLMQAWITKCEQSTADITPMQVSYCNDVTFVLTEKLDTFECANEMSK